MWPTTLPGPAAEGLPVSRVRLPGGQRITVRPVSPRDRRRLRRRFLGTGRDRCQLGTLAGGAGGTGSRTGGFFRLDPPRSVFYVAVAGKGLEERIVGLCGWRTADPRGDVEVVMGLFGNEERRREIGRALLDLVAAAGASLGIERLRAYVLPEDLVLQDVFEHGGAPVLKDFARGCYEYSIRPVAAAA